mmetsp:Transcript_6399/g.11005  ORF Transcript_6399/g.11005 Transcript_6399/m.11005 type:complete len:288 (-) Transcript_6399:62-925(-)
MRPKEIDEYLRTYYQTNTVPRGGYGQELPIEFKGANVKNLMHGDRTGPRWMDVLEPWDPIRFKASVGPVIPICPRLVQFSENSYESKALCVDEEEASSVVATKNVSTDCHVLSVGSNDQWGFEEEVRQKLSHCYTHTFDCTLDGSPQKKPKDPNVKFYPYCVGGGSEDKVDRGNGNAFRTYAELVEATGIQHPPKLLKMDIEGFEYDVLTSMLNSSPEFLPQQIMMEVHWASRMVGLEWMLRTRQTAELAMFFDLMFNKGGYLPIRVEYFGSGCPTCMEILMLRVQC